MLQQSVSFVHEEKPETTWDL